MIIRVSNLTGARTDGLAVWSSVTLSAVDSLILQIVDSHYPKRSEIYVTSGTDSDHGAVSYHYGIDYQGSPAFAVDFGAYTGTTRAEGDRRMRDFAKWICDNFTADTVELIHTTPYADNGFYIKYGIRRAPGYYGAATEAAHVNHVHWALSEAGAKRILARLGAAAPAPAPVSTVAPIFAWDLSDFDYARGARPANVKTAAGEGIRILTHKATEQSIAGVTKHVHLAEMLAAGRDAGIPFLGPYVVVRSGVSAAAQAATAIAYVRQQIPWWFSFPGRFWHVDLEKWPYDSVPASLGEQVGAELERQSGVPVRSVLYASKGQYGDTLPGIQPLWNANYSDSGAARPFRQQWADVVAAGLRGFARYSGRVPVLLQFASDAVIGGIGPSDASAFRGTEVDFASLIGASKPAPRPTPLPTSGDSMFAVKESTLDTVYVSNGLTYRPLSGWATLVALASSGALARPTADAKVDGSGLVLVVPDGQLAQHAGRLDSATALVEDDLAALAAAAHDGAAGAKDDIAKAVNDEIGRRQAA